MDKGARLMKVGWMQMKVWADLLAGGSEAQVLYFLNSTDHLLRMACKRDQRFEDLKSEEDLKQQLHKMKE